MLFKELLVCGTAVNNHDLGPKDKTILVSGVGRQKMRATSEKYSITDLKN